MSLFFTENYQCQCSCWSTLLSAVISPRQHPSQPHLSPVSLSCPWQLPPQQARPHSQVTPPLALLIASHHLCSEPLILIIKPARFPPSSPFSVPISPTPLCPCLAHFTSCPGPAPVLKAAHCHDQHVPSVLISWLVSSPSPGGAAECLL